MLFCKSEKENSMKQFNEQHLRHEILLMIMNLKKKGPFSVSMKEVISELWNTPNTEYIVELHSLLEDMTEINEVA